MPQILQALLMLLTIAYTSNNFAHGHEVKFRFPIAEEDRWLIKNFPIYGFDNDPRDRMAIQCRNYNGRIFPRCYDGHEGTDFMLRGRFRTMDHGSAKIVAAESGVVTRVVDGNYDRCRLNIFKFGVSCKGHPMVSNTVEITHADGSKTRYLHMKKHSIIVREGQTVECGQELGLVGSSGLSTAPHLHFALIDAQGKPRDPYKGVWSQDYSFWKLQRARDGLPGGSCF